MRKVAIVARAPSTRYRAPFDDPSWEIWTLSPMGAPHYSDLPRWDRFYELHHMDDKDAEVPGVIDYFKLYGEKVWLREPHSALPKAQVYPRQKVFDHFQNQFTNQFRYYNNQVTLMIVHAILEGIDELAIYGTDMSQTQEYQTQKPSCEWAIGWAAGSGVKVTIPEECDLCKLDRVYALEDHGWRERKLHTHIKELEEKLSRDYRKLDESKKKQVGAAAAAGELQTLVETMEKLNGQGGPPELLGAVKTRLGNLEKAYELSKAESDKLDQDIKLFTGALEEARYQTQFI